MSLNSILKLSQHVTHIGEDFFTFRRVSSWNNDDSLTGQGDPLDEEFQNRRRMLLPEATRYRKPIPDDFYDSEISMKKKHICLTLMPVALEMAIRKYALSLALGEHHQKPREDKKSVSADPSPTWNFSD